MADETARLDGWQNLLTSYGSHHDPIEHSRPRLDVQMQRETAEAIYRSDGIGRRIVDLLAEEMTREWITVHGDNAEDRERDLRDIGAKKSMNQALRWAGLYGGAVTFMLIDDGTDDPAIPVQETRVRGVRDLIVYDRWQTTWSQADISTDPASPLFGRAERVRISPITGTPFTAHVSRLLVWDGEDVPDRLRQQNNGWGDSRLQPVQRALARYAEGLSGTSSIIRDFILPVLSMKNLSDMIASGQEDVVRKRLEILGISRSMLNVLLIDADEEGYEKKASAVSGIDKLLQELKHNLSACTGIPQTKLFGRAPEGMDATGEGDIRNWYDQVKSEQESKLLPNLTRLVYLMDLADGGAPDDRAIICNPLWQPSKAEQSATQKIAVETATLALDMGLMDLEAAQRYIEGFGVDTGGNN